MTADMASRAKNVQRRDRIVSVNELETILRGAGWDKNIIRLIMKPPVARVVWCGEERLILKSGE